MSKPVRAIEKGIKHMFAKTSLKHKYKAYKWLKIIKDSGLFDEEYYLGRYPDVQGSKMSAIKHYIHHGASEGRNPSKEFNTRYYLQSYKDVDINVINPLVHYVLYGRKEGRMNTKNLTLNSHIIYQKSISEHVPVLNYNMVGNRRRITLLYVEHTANFDRITGVQRVCYELSSRLANNVNEIVILVKLDCDTLNICPLNTNEQNNFIKKSGFIMRENERMYYNPDAFKTVLNSLRTHPKKHWLVIPEVTYHSTHTPEPTSRLIKLARDYGLNVGAIFYDMIPLLLDCTSSNAQKHCNYISELSLVDIIWPISQYSALGLIDYLSNVEHISVQQMPTIVVNSLPDEGTDRRMIGDLSEHCINILCLGTIDSRKNQITLVKAFNKYCESNKSNSVRLNIVGMIRDDYRCVIESECKKNSNIILHYNANDNQIKSLFHESRFTVFPSTEEGYGLPIVESLWHMKPCICANFGSMYEIGDKGGCLTIDVNNADEIEAAISEMISNKPLYDKKINEIIMRKTKTWHEYSSDILNDMDAHEYGPSNTGLIYYWVDATISAHGNTGIQRVNRQLAKHLINQGHKLVPIKWDDILHDVVLADYSDLEYLEKWNGPSRNLWYKRLDMKTHGNNATYLMVDLPLNRSLSIQNKVIDMFKSVSIRCAAIFYDAIPYNLSDMYPSTFTNAHVEYMETLDRMDYVFSISQKSNSDLLDFLTKSSVRGLSLSERLITVSLPEEFPHRDRMNSVVDSHDNSCMIVAVGTIEPRKNHIKLLEAFLKAEKKSKVKLELVLIGSDDTFDKVLHESVQLLINKSLNISWVKDANDDVLDSYYSKCKFTIFPSIEEGFGLPIVESLWKGKPCICANFGQMNELAIGGGCLSVDVRNIDMLAKSIISLSNDSVLYDELISQLVKRYFKTWDNYATEISSLMYNIHKNSESKYKKFNSAFDFKMPEKPIISVCITTYNRKNWLDINIKNFIDIAGKLKNRVELVICDNASSEDVDDVLFKYQNHEQISFYRNSCNIGMLGNLSQTVSLARGEYIWLIGDDDLIHKGSLERVIAIIEDNDVDIINLNYSFNTDPEPPSKSNIKRYLKSSTVVCDGSVSHAGLVKETSCYNENFYTAIYSFVAKRNYALRIYSQDTSGEPFSSLQTCVPTSKYILSNMMNAKSYWVSDSLITVNLNVSWGEHAPIWILERVPEVYDLAELNGAASKDVDKWRQHTLKSSVSYLDMVYTTTDYDLYSEFSMERFISRNRHLSCFGNIFNQVEIIYERAFKANHPLAILPIENLRRLMYEQNS